MQIFLLTIDSGLVITVGTVDYSNILLSVPTTNTNWSKYKHIRRVNTVGLSAFITICHLHSSGKVENICEESVGECTTVACAKTREMYLGWLADSLSVFPTFATQYFAYILNCTSMNLSQVIFVKNWRHFLSWSYLNIIILNLQVVLVYYSFYFTISM